MVSVVSSQNSNTRDFSGSTLSGTSDCSNHRPPASAARLRFGCRYCAALVRLKVDGNSRWADQRYGYLVRGISGGRYTRNLVWGARFRYCPHSALNPSTPRINQLNQASLVPERAWEPKSESRPRVAWPPHSRCWVTRVTKRPRANMLACWAIAATSLLLS